MIVIEDGKNKFSPFIVCEICKEKIIGPNAGTAAYLPKIGGQAKVIFVHNNIDGKTCLKQGDATYGYLSTQCIDHHLHMLLHNTKIEFSEERLESFKCLESF